MLKLLIYALMIVFFSACGVNTSSSPVERASSNASTDSNTDNTSTVGLDLIDPNPVYSDSGSDTNTSSGTDTNSTGADTNTTIVVADQSKSTFDVSGASLDQYACVIGDRNNGYTDKSMSDTSMDDRGSSDESYGVLINSLLPLNRSDPESTIVTVFYYALTVQRDDTWKNIYESNQGYKLSVDTAWSRNDRRVMYVMTPKNTNGYYRCYRYDFSSLSEGTFTSTKVYRNNL